MFGDVTMKVKIKVMQRRNMASLKLKAVVSGVYIYTFFLSFQNGGKIHLISVNISYQHHIGASLLNRFEW